MSCAMCHFIYHCHFTSSHRHGRAKRAARRRKARRLEGAESSLRESRGAQEPAQERYPHFLVAEREIKTGENKTQHGASEEFRAKEFRWLRHCRRPRGRLVRRVDLDEHRGSRRGCFKV